MVAWGLLGIAAGALLSWRLSGPVAALATAGILAVDPQMILQSIVLQADGPATSLALLAVAAAAFAITSPDPRVRTTAAGVSGALLALGLLTKLLDAAAVPALVAVLIGGRDQRRLLLSALAGGTIVVLCLLVPWMGSLSMLAHQVIGSQLGVGWLGRPPGTFVLATLQTEWQPLALAAVGAVIARRSHPRLVAVGVVWLIGGVVALAAAQSGFAHLTVALSPGIALLGAAGISRLCTILSGARRAPGWLKVTLLATAIAAGASLLGNTLASLPRTFTPSEVQIEQSLERLVPPSATVYGDGQFDQAAADRLPPDLLQDTSKAVLRDTPITTAFLETRLGSSSGVCAVLFGPMSQLAEIPGFNAGWPSTPGPILSRRRSYALSTAALRVGSLNQYKRSSTQLSPRLVRIWAGSPCRRKTSCVAQRALPDGRSPRPRLPAQPARPTAAAPSPPGA